LDLQRRRGENGQFSNFGFVPEAIALRLELQPGQELVLKDVNSGEKVFTLPYGSPFPSHTVYVSNTRLVPTEASDFGMYYVLFPDIPKDERFDFQANKGADKMWPLNPDPTYTARTCCQMACTAIFLSQTKALK
jgi:hypothetical protein